jgi:DNA-binding CsgD family transcriptional regulator
MSPFGKASEPSSAGFQRHPRLHIAILGHDLNVVFADAWVRDFFSLHPKGMTRPLLSLIQDELRSILQRSEKPESEHVLGPVAGSFFRILPLSGSFGTFYAICFENEARREDMKEAAARFSLSPRELEVLDRVLQGMKATEIAQDLHIAETTVFDHFKRISQKTNARNRTNMVAKILNWQGGARRDF